MSDHDINAPPKLAGLGSSIVLVSKHFLEEGDLVASDAVPTTNETFTLSAALAQKKSKKGDSDFRTAIVSHTSRRQRRSRRQTTGHHKAARLIQLINNKPREIMNHTYYDLADVPPETADDADFPCDVDKMSFNEKVYHILMQPEYQQWMSWLPHGRAFRVDIPVAFEREVCTKYFGHKRYSSFLRQLNNHSFRHLTHGPDRNAYYHECLLRGRPHLLKHMPGPKDARRLLPDALNEPNFYSISKLYPLEPESHSQLPPQGIPFNMVSQPIISAGYPVLHGRLASSVNWLADTAPSSKRTHFEVPMQNLSATDAIGHAFMNGHGQIKAPDPVDMPLPQRSLPLNNNSSNSTHIGGPDYLLTALLQQMAANPQLISQSNLQSTLPLQFQQPSHPAPTVDWLRQLQQDFQ